MKLSEFKGGRNVLVQLGDGTVFSVTYNPRFFVGAAIDYFNEFIGLGENKTGAQQCDDAYAYIASLISEIDITDDDGTKIPPTVENLKNRIELDLSTMRQIHQACFEDMERRANPTLPTEGDSSSGSTQEGNSTQKS